MKSAIITILFTLLATTGLFANQGTEKAPSIFDHWANTSVIDEVTIYLDRAELESKRMTDESINARLTDSEQAYELTVEVRGRYRRKSCIMPPLKIHFNKQWLAQAGYNNHNDFKLVTHCTMGDEGQESILREQLAYELYRTVAPETAFRTQLLKVNYVDTQTGSSETSYAILIEDTDELKDRMNAESCKSCYGISSNKIENEARVTLFNYMIGNSDYSFKMGRNLKLLKPEGSNKFIAVPYDFDFSGLVSASYAKYAEKTTTVRRMVWEFGGEPQLASARGQFLYQKSELIDVVDNFTELSKDSRREIVAYLYDFFAEIENTQIAR